jgi:hypothetical protein
MALMVRIDVDRPYGREPWLRHVLSRVSSDYFLPTFESMAYLAELKWMLGLLNKQEVRAHVFFRRCTRPSPAVLEMIRDGGHEMGLHLEDSRSYETFLREKSALEAALNQPVHCFSKHGSGGFKFGFHHYAPYEPEKYMEWGARAGMKLFLGNLEDPALPAVSRDRCVCFPSAFWLEPSWRDLARYPVRWLLSRMETHDVVLLVHPENVKASPGLTEDFQSIIHSGKQEVAR